MACTLDDKYTFEIQQEGNAQLILLTQKQTGLVKEFPSVAKSIIGLVNHMSSMTEDTCKGFFLKI
jgi:hypothetical protein